MAHSRAAKKRIRQTERRTIANRSRTSRIRTYLKKVELAIAGADKQAAHDAFVAVQPEMMRGASHGLVHRNLVARNLPPLSTLITAVAPSRASLSHICSLEAPPPVPEGRFRFPMPFPDLHILGTVLQGL